jgi:urease accessory protein
MSAFVSALAGGLLQPLTVPAHVLALVALGLCIGQHGAARRAVMAAFAAGLAGGLIAIAGAARPTFAVDVLLVATVLAGGAAAMARPLPVLVSVSLAAIMGAALGLDSPPQAISLTSAHLALLGTGLGAWLLLALVSAGTRLLGGALRAAPRILGSWAAASAIMGLALRLGRSAPY